MKMSNANVGSSTTSTKTATTNGENLANLCSASASKSVNVNALVEFLNSIETSLKQAEEKISIDLLEPPCSLIIHVLEQAMAANDTAPAAKANANANANAADSSSKSSSSNRSNILKLIAVKTASLLDWNLVKFEKEIPIDLLNELLISLLNFTLSDSEKNIKKVTEIDVKKLDKQTLFAFQLIHRWYLRVIVYIKFPTNLPGLLNPLQHMKDANSKTTKSKLDYMTDSVSFLEKFIKFIHQDLLKPTSDCFKNINTDTGTYDLDWTKSTVVPIDDIKNIINYDLGMFFFQQENYEKSHDYFQSVRKYKNKINSNEKKVNELNTYANELDSYITACRSILNLEIDLDDQVKNNTNEQYAKQVITKMILIENCIKNNLKGMFEYSHLSIGNPLVLESIIAQQSDDSDDFVIDGNVTHLLTDSNGLLADSCNLDQLKFLPPDIYTKMSDESYLVFVQNKKHKSINKDFLNKKHCSDCAGEMTTCCTTTCTTTSLNLNLKEGVNAKLFGDKETPMPTPHQTTTTSTTTTCRNCKEQLHLISKLKNLSNNSTMSAAAASFLSSSTHSASAAQAGNKNPSDSESLNEAPSGKKGASQRKREKRKQKKKQQQLILQQQQQQQQQQESKPDQDMPQLEEIPKPDEKPATATEDDEKTKAAVESLKSTAKTKQPNSKQSNSNKPGKNTVAKEEKELKNPTTQTSNKKKNQQNAPVVNEKQQKQSGKKKKNGKGKSKKENTNNNNNKNAAKTPAKVTPVVEQSTCESNTDDEAEEEDDEENSESTQMVSGAKKTTLADLDDIDSSLDYEPASNFNNNTNKKLADLDDFDEPIVKHKSTEIQHKNHHKKSSSYSSTVANAANNLADLDDFERPLFQGQASSSKQSSSKTPAAPESTVYNDKQKMFISADKLRQVLGKENANLKIIQDLTGAKLELTDSTASSSSSSTNSNNNGKTIIIKGASSEVTEFAIELIQTLISNADVDLFNLLPQSPTQQQPAGSSNDPVSVTTTANTDSTTKKQSTNSSRPTTAATTTSSASKAQLSHKPTTATSGVRLPNSVTRLEDYISLPVVVNSNIQHNHHQKPRNFAEAVAKNTQMGVRATALTSSRLLTPANSGQSANSLLKRHNSVSPARSKPTTAEAMKPMSNGPTNASNVNINSAGLFADRTTTVGADLVKKTNIVKPLVNEFNSLKLAADSVAPSAPPQQTPILTVSTKTLSSIVKPQATSKPTSIVAPYATVNPQGDSTPSTDAAALKLSLSVGTAKSLSADSSPNESASNFLNAQPRSQLTNCTQLLQSSSSSSSLVHNGSANFPSLQPINDLVGGGGGGFFEPLADPVSVEPKPDFLNHLWPVDTNDASSFLVNRFSPYVNDVQPETIGLNTAVTSSSVGVTLNNNLNAAVNVNNKPIGYERHGKQNTPNDSNNNFNANGLQTVKPTGNSLAMPESLLSIDSNALQYLNPAQSQNATNFTTKQYALINPTLANQLQPTPNQLNYLFANNSTTSRAPVSTSATTPFLDVNDKSSLIKNGLGPVDNVNGYLVNKLNATTPNNSLIIPPNAPPTQLYSQFSTNSNSNTNTNTNNSFSQSQWLNFGHQATQAPTSMSQHQQQQQTQIDMLNAFLQNSQQMNQFAGPSMSLSNQSNNQYPINASAANSHINFHPQFPQTTTGSNTTATNPSLAGISQFNFNNTFNTSNQYQLDLIDSLKNNLNSNQLNLNQLNMQAAAAANQQKQYYF